MRYVGNYDPATIASFAELVAIHTPNMRQSLEPLEERIEAAIETYMGAWPDVCNLTPLDLTKDERATLTAGYDTRNVAIKRRLATMMNSLTAGHRDLCPFCNLDTGAELDHYLPKDIFAEFSLNAANLVPICGVCNKRKSSVYRDPQGRKYFILPLFDLQGNHPFIECEISFAPEISASYSVVDNEAMAEGEVALCNRHFARLNLAERYSKRAVGFLAAAKLNLRSIERSTAERIWRSQIAPTPFEPTNSWRPALYREASNLVDETLDWFEA